MLFGMGELPEEVKQAFEDQHTRLAMTADAWRNEVNGLFGELAIPQLVTLKKLVHHMAGDETGQFTSYVEGILAGLLTFKHEVCVSCGENHEQKMLADAVKEGEVGPEGMIVEPDLEEHMLKERNLDLKMKEYGLEWHKEPEDAEGKSPGIILRCANCKTHYVSLDDRMVKQPGVEGCDGCIQKSKWG